MTDPIDPRLARELDRLTVPALPADFAERIVARAQASTAAAAANELPPLPRARRAPGRWMRAGLIGTATLAAGLLSISAAAEGYFGEPLRRAVHRIPIVHHLAERIERQRHHPAVHLHNTSLPKSAQPAPRPELHAPLATRMEAQPAAALPAQTPVMAAPLTRKLGERRLDALVHRRIEQRRMMPMIRAYHQQVPVIASPAPRPTPLALPEAEVARPPARIERHAFTPPVEQRLSGPLLTAEERATLSPAEQTALRKVRRAQRQETLRALRQAPALPSPAAAGKAEGEPGLSGQQNEAADRGETHPDAPRAGSRRAGPRPTMPHPRKRPVAPRRMRRL